VGEKRFSLNHPAVGTRWCGSFVIPREWDQAEMIREILADPAFLAFAATSRVGDEYPCRLISGYWANVSW
jgi:hypothetical protein